MVIICGASAQQNTGQSINNNTKAGTTPATVAPASPVDWSKWQNLMGDWRGQDNGKPGATNGSFNFRKDMDGYILVRNNRTRIQGEAGKPAVFHRDMMIIYPDASGNPVKAIYFDNEGHAINYTASFQDKAIVLTSDAIQKSPRYRLSYETIDSVTVNVKFEMSTAQKPEVFKTYLEGKSTKNVRERPGSDRK
jgi:hypothetical protein